MAGRLYRAATARAPHLPFHAPLRGVWEGWLCRAASVTRLATTPSRNGSSIAPPLSRPVAWRVGGMALSRGERDSPGDDARRRRRRLPRRRPSSSSSLSSSSSSVVDVVVVVNASPSRVVRIPQHAVTPTRHTLRHTPTTCTHHHPTATTTTSVPHAYHPNQHTITATRAQQTTTNQPTYTRNATHIHTHTQCNTQRTTQTTNTI